MTYEYPENKSINQTLISTLQYDHMILKPTETFKSAYIRKGKSGAWMCRVATLCKGTQEHWAPLLLTIEL